MVRYWVDTFQLRSAVQLWEADIPEDHEGGVEKGVDTHVDLHMRLQNCDWTFIVT